MRLKGTPTRPKIKPSSEWAREAPVGATALIIAECTTKGRLNRRVALDWLFGERSKAAPLRSAATKLVDTGGLSTSGTESERHENDGSVCLATSERCQTRWTVRSIPVGIIQCWAGFEDGISQLGQSAEMQQQPREPIPALTAQQLTAPVSLEAVSPLNTTAAQPLPALAPSAPSLKPAVTQRPVRAHPLPVFAPLAALILNMNEAFSGNCAVPGGDFITDGRILLLRSACDETFLSKLKPGICAAFGPDNPVPAESTRKLFYSTVQDAKYEAKLVGYVLGASMGNTYESSRPFACIAGPGERITVANGHCVLLIQNVTGANRVMQSADPKSLRITFFKDAKPVALLMALNESSLNDVFRDVLNTTKNSSNVSVISSAMAHRVAV
jgi:hypothetical protein